MPNAMQIGSQISNKEFLKQVIQYANQHNLLTPEHADELIEQSTILWQSLMHQWGNVPGTRSFDYSEPSDIITACKTIEKIISFSLIEASNRDLGKAVNILQTANLAELFSKISKKLKNIRLRTIALLEQSFETVKFDTLLILCNSSIITYLPENLFNKLCALTGLNLLTISDLSEIYEAEQTLNHCQKILKFSKVLPWQKLFTSLNFEIDQKKKTLEMELIITFYKPSVDAEINIVSLIMSIIFNRLLIKPDQIIVLINDFKQNQSLLADKNEFLTNTRKFIDAFTSDQQLIIVIMEHLKEALKVLNEIGANNIETAKDYIILSHSSKEEKTETAKSLYSQMNPDELMAELYAISDDDLALCILAYLPAQDLLNEEVITRIFRIPQDRFSELFANFPWENIDWNWIIIFLKHDDRNHTPEFCETFIAALIKYGSSKLWRGKKTIFNLQELRQFLVHPNTNSQITSKLLAKIKPSSHDLSNSRFVAIDPFLIEWCSYHPASWYTLCLELTDESIRPDNLKKLIQFLKNQPEKTRKRLLQILYFKTRKYPDLQKFLKQQIENAL